MSSQSDFSSEFAALSPSQQVEVVQFMRSLKPAPTREERRAAILKFAGSISPEDIELMTAAIEEGCGRVCDDKQ